MKPISIQDIVTVTGGTLLQGDASLLVVNVTTDSREAKDGTLFVPIVGERRDGHEFIPSVFEQGAVCTFTEREKPQTEAGVYIRVENSLKALQALAAWYRSLFSAVTVIGVTGSVGKTTTKEMIAAVLEKKYRVLKTYGNMNSQIGLARMMFELDDQIEVAVIEMGISEHGEMDRLVHIARPELAVLTNVGMSHIGNLG
ncbi:MAG: UDP-N-acetylmuramoyl-tripeptide--D-alanyl-D-alanine ligase, partial [Lachnospiraceae bacterium]|nr:UDP-N-acetylmuramoyl-tripeptide--D-alanyl-D-alanine ligase [Lachnospiraceae bacterium]